MNTKLTLSINSKVIDKAKRYLRSGDQSLSNLVESYFRILVQTKQKRTGGTTLVKELTGIAKGVGKSPENIIADYLQDKYK